MKPLFSILLFYLFFSTAPAQATSKTDSLKRLLATRKNDPELLNLIAKEYSKFSPDSCKYWADKALHHSLKNNDDANTARSFQTIGYYYILTGDLDSGTFFFRKSLVTAGKTKDPLIMAAGNIYLGYASLLGGEARGALGFLEAARQYQDKAPSGEQAYRQYAMMYMYYAEAYNMAGLLDKATDSAFKGLAYAEKAKDIRWQAMLIATIGNTYKLLKDWEKSNLYYHKAILLARDLNDATNMQNYYVNTAANYIQLQQYDAARLCLDTSFRLLQQFNNPAKTGYLYHEYGKLYHFQKKYDSARAYLNRALAAFQEAGISYRQADCYYWLGDVDREQHKVEAAIGNYTSSLQLYQEAGQTDQTKDVLMALSEMEERRGHLKEALAYEKAYSSILDTLFNEEKAAAITASEIRYETAAKEARIARQQAEIKLKNLQRNLLIAGIILASLVITALIRLYRKTRKQKQVIGQQKDEISRQKNDLEITNQFILHNTRDNLDLLCDIFRIQAEVAENKDIAEANQWRVNAIRTLSALLYEHSGQAGAGVQALLQRICELKQISFNVPIQVAVLPPELELKVTLLKDIALIVDEFTTNALRRGLKGIAHPEVWVQVSIQGNLLCIRVADNGTGLPPDFDVQAKRRTSGMRLVNYLVTANQGTWRAWNNNGAVFEAVLTITR